MPVKLIIGEIRHETNTFSNIATTTEHFKAHGWHVGEEILPNFRGVRSALGGMIDRAEQLNIELVPTLATTTQPSGTITSETYNDLADELLSRIQEADKADAICLSLHGAGVAEGIEDLEGELLISVRRLVGYEIPLIIALDLHANLTRQMIEETDAVFGDNYYPHIDSYERGIEAVDTAVQMVQGQLRPVMHFIRLPLMIPTIGTRFSPLKEINEACHAWERRAGMIDCTLFHGFPFSDISRPGVSVLATANNDADAARRAAEDIAGMAWKMKDEFFLKQPSSSEGIQRALRFDAKNVVINEMSDNPGGGAPGDGTRLLAAMLEAGVTNACFAPMYDPEVAAAAHRAGVGADIDVLLGGKTDDLHGKPLRVNAYVKALTDGRFVQSSPMGKGKEVNLGKCARLQVNGVDIVVCSVRTQLFDEELFLLHGIDIFRYKIIALKSSYHFRARFEQLCDEIISVDSPGLCTLQFAGFPFQNVKGKVYPLSADAALA